MAGVVIASKNGSVGIREAVEVLRRGGSAIDAVEAGIRPVESNPDDHSVGYSGLPNLLGQVELDSSIMDGRTLATGAVGAIKDYEHPISIARKVMEDLPHVILVGTGAERFAAEMGFEKKDLLTEEARLVYEKLWTEKFPEVYGHRERYLDRMREMVKHAADPEKPNETVNFIARDDRGDIACGVSTSGWAWKYPGRLGDSPIIGAGNYADNRYGAAACTGRGEMAIRAGTARSVVLYLKMGMALHEAGGEAMKDLHAVVDPYIGSMNIVAMDAHGNHAAFTNSQGATYVFMTTEMKEPEEKPRILVPTPGVTG
ncbi:MAG: N(4)-(beta-N-acetylglucosaminyl)-L-asparaginase [Bacillota bacterium]